MPCRRFYYLTSSSQKSPRLHPIIGSFLWVGTVRLPKRWDVFVSRFLKNQDIKGVIQQ